MGRAAYGSPSSLRVVREADPVHNVELRRDRHGHESVVFAFPYRARGRRRRAQRSPAAASTGTRKEWWALQADGTAPYVKGVIERHSWLKVAPRRPALAGRGGHRLGRARRRRQAATAAGASCSRRSPASCPTSWPRSPTSAAGGCGCRSPPRSRRRSSEMKGARFDERGAALRPAAAGRARAGAGHAVADRERGGAAAQARRQLGPGDDPRLPRAARLRGARPLAAGRPVPARAARALPAHVRRRGRRRTPPTCSSACGPSTTRRSSTCGARAPTTGPALAVEAELGGELRPFQRAGVAYALKARRTFLADEQGLGKTVQALAALEADGAYPAVVVCPACLKLNWQRETERWLPERSLTVVSGTGATPKLADITILNYDIVHAHRARLSLARAAGARARRVALRQEPARQAHARGAAARRGAARGRAAARADRHAGDEPPRRADRPAAGARPARGVRLRRALLAPLPGRRRGGAHPLAPAPLAASCAA